VRRKPRSETGANEKYHRRNCRYNRNRISFETVKEVAVQYPTPKVVWPGYTQLIFRQDPYS
jgi:hypothetical protein